MPRNDGVDRASIFPIRRANPLSGGMLIEIRSLIAGRAHREAQEIGEFVAQPRRPCSADAIFLRPIVDEREAQLRRQIGQRKGLSLIALPSLLVSVNVQTTGFFLELVERLSNPRTMLRFLRTQLGT